MICSVCGRDVEKTYTLEGGELCHDCLLDIADDPQLVADKLPDFIARHQKEFVDWVCDTSQGDCYGIQSFVERHKAQAVEEWRESDPEAHKKATQDFRDCCTGGEWEDFLKSLERSE